MFQHSFSPSLSNLPVGYHPPTPACRIAYDVCTETTPAPNSHASSGRKSRLTNWSKTGNWLPLRPIPRSPICKYAMPTTATPHPLLAVESLQLRTAARHRTRLVPFLEQPLASCLASFSRPPLPEHTFLAPRLWRWERERVMLFRTRCPVRHGHQRIRLRSAPLECR